MFKPQTNSSNVNESVMSSGI